MVATTLVTAAPSSVPSRPKVEATTAADTAASAPASTCTTLSGTVVLAWSCIAPRACPRTAHCRRPAPCGVLAARPADRPPCRVPPHARDGSAHHRQRGVATRAGMAPDLLHTPTA